NGVEGGRFSAAKTAAFALQNIAAVDAKAQQMCRRASASRAGAGNGRIRGPAGVNCDRLRCVDLRYAHLFAMPVPVQGSGGLSFLAVLRGGFCSLYYCNHSAVSWRAN